MDIIALLTLTILEIVLGIDNIIFISILVGRLPQADQKRARLIGLTGALVLRIIFLFMAQWIAGLVTPLFTVPEVFGMTAPFIVSGRDLIMLSGGIFLLYKATTEIHAKIEGAGDHSPDTKKPAVFGAMIVQIMLLDLVFSIDSVITAIGLSQDLVVMIIAVVISIIVMQISSGTISGFIEKHPTVKVLALAFLMMVGLVLVAEGFHAHVPKGYVYFAMAFSMAVEFLNLRIRKKASV